MTADISQWLKTKFASVIRTALDLKGYQNTAVQFMYDNPFSALFLDTGLGKTAALLKLIQMLIVREECQNVLIIGPQRVVGVTWPDEIEQWEFSAWFEHTIIRDDELIKTVNKAGQEATRQAKLDGCSAELTKALALDARRKAGRKAVRAMMLDRKAHVYLIHKEQVEFLVDAFGKAWPFDTVIIDESSSLKDHSTKRWKALWKIRPLVKRMHQLTGTPVAEGWRFIYAQVTLLDKGTRFGKSSTKFENKYFIQNKYDRRWTIREGAEQEITELISDICLVMKQEDYLDLEQPTLVQHKVHLSPKQMALYQEMADEFVIELDDGTEVEAETAAALSQKLLQMASGVVYDTILEEQADGNLKKRRIVHELHDDKIEALRQLEQDLNGETMLVAYYHQSSLERILKAFPHAKVMDKKGANIKLWNKGKIKMFLIHPMSDAHGLNLQHGGRHVVFFDLPWSYESYYQLYRRLARQGQKLAVVIHQLISVGTIDEVVAACLEGKKDTQEIFFKMITSLRRKMRKKQKAFEL